MNRENLETKLVEEYPNPTYIHDEDFALDSDVMVLARAICGEGK